MQAVPRHSWQSADRYELLGRLWECDEDEKHTRPSESSPSERWPTRTLSHVCKQGESLRHFCKSHVLGRRNAHGGLVHADIHPHKNKATFCVLTRNSCADSQWTVSYSPVATACCHVILHNAHMDSFRKGTNQGWRRLCIDHPVENW